MPQNATENVQTPALTPVQVEVLQALLLGDTVSSAAVSAGVDRTTVHRWQRSDHQFRAALNRGRGELLMAVQGKLIETAVHAADTVAAAVKAGDVPAALAVLRGCGALSGTAPTIGSDDPSVLDFEAEHAVARAEMAQRQEAVDAAERLRKIEMDEFIGPLGL